MSNAILYIFISIGSGIIPTALVAILCAANGLPTFVCSSVVFLACVVFMLVLLCACASGANDDQKAGRN